ncbi:hypothetical protein MJO28_003238 [Puccinia striiformis f. sp. tritici]|uniref:S1 motif domain-containing protein n=2 Tax=Puccinia striiformis TaxID=27350 RepID=A0A2S4VQL6_9BASI|nr:hypothetical protein MJO28_003238 [Puccinia striiformis f. sp. tritici]POW11836.1 hypothetical protein PSHT_08309 [Puccinia striiformis]
MRYYRPRFPEPDDLVMVQVKQIQEMGAYVKLLEYDNIEGMILLSELSRRRIRSIQKLIRVGRNEVVVVMRVDKEKGYIDLSKRRVSAEDVVKCEERVSSIIRHVSEKTELDMETVNEMVAWPLFEKYGHAFDAFKLSITEPETVFGQLNIPENVMMHLTANIARRLTPQPVKVRADIEATCFAYSGIDAIRTALKLGESIGTESVPIKIRLVAPPLYVMVSNATDKQGAIELLETAIERIGESLKKDGGQLTVKMKPKAVSETDDLELAALMERVARENKEVSGDEDSDAD